MSTQGSASATDSRIPTSGRDVVRMRDLARWAPVAVIALSLLASAVLGAPTSAGLAVAVVAAFLGVAAWQIPRWRVYLLAVASAVTLFLTPDAEWATPAAAALLYLAVTNDRRHVPWPALVAGSVGATASVVWFSYLMSPLGFVAAMLGLCSGLLARALDRSSTLTRETRALRDRTRASEEQARWLEQRTALARELHDVVGHHVTAMVVQAEAGQVGDPRHALRTIGDLGRTALDELDALVVYLRDPSNAVTMTAPPRLTDVDEILAAPLRRQGVDVVVHMEPGVGLDDLGELTAYRIIQESLTNVARHAGASHAWVELVRSDRHVRVRVSDDGVGPPQTPTRGAGLVGIGERVSALGGMWSISTRPGGGTMVDAYLPVGAELDA